MTTTMIEMSFYFVDYLKEIKNICLCCRLSGWPEPKEFFSAEGSTGNLSLINFNMHGQSIWLYIKMNNS